MKTRLVIGLFFCVAFVQTATPLLMIARRESVLANGIQCKFKTAPVDPYDAFRGRYVALQLEKDYAPAFEGLMWTSGQTVYALIEVDEQGFARFSALDASRPLEKAYLQAKVRYVSGDKVYLDLPIDRYYMEEKSAPAAERMYRRHAQQDTYVVVRIKDGMVVIENLFVGGERVEDALKQEKGNSL